ncbi:MAG: hypothetical protein MZU91_01860 [Desulfosudis oleivorans]|nr:hypothetical protein [Desulfosudis oleivorans]
MAVATTVDSIEAEEQAEHDSDGDKDDPFAGHEILSGWCCNELGNHTPK